MTFPSDSTKPPAPHRCGCGDDYDSDAPTPTWGQVDRPDKLLGYDHMDWPVNRLFGSDSTELPAQSDRAAQILQRMDRESQRAARKWRKLHKPSIRTLVRQAEKATGKPVTSITTPDGMTLRFGEPEPGALENPWFADLDKAKRQ